MYEHLLWDRGDFLDLRFVSSVGKRTFCKLIMVHSRIFFLEFGLVVF